MATKLPPGKRTKPLKTRLSFGIPPDQVLREMEASAIKRQKDYLDELADRIERGDLLDRKIDRVFAAGAIRAFAKAMKPAVKKRGRPRKVHDPGGAAISVALKRKSMTRAEAISAVALEFGVDDRTISKIYDDHILMLRSLGLNPEA